MSTGTLRTGGLARAELLIGLAICAAVVVAIVAILRMDPRGARAERTGANYVEQARAAAALERPWIRWGEVLPPIAVPMARPRGLAVDGAGGILVVGDRLVVLAAAGEVRLRSAPFDVDYVAVAPGPDGRVFAAAPTRIDVFELAAGALRIVGSRRFGDEEVGLASVVVTAQGIFAADAYGSRVLRLPLDGEGFSVFADGLFVPSAMDLGVDPEGEVITVDPGRHLVQTRDGYGDVIRSFGRHGPGVADFHGCCNPAAIARFADGRTATAEKGLIATRVKVYDADGALESVVAGIDAFDERPDGPPIVLDVAVDADGRVLVLDPSRKQVRVFAPKGAAAQEGEGR